MIVVCPKCSLRLQANETQTAPQRPFSIRCPKCNTTINSGPPSPASDQSALSVGNSPATEHRRYENVMPAPFFNPEQDGREAPASLSPTEELSRLLASLLNQNYKGSTDVLISRPPWNPRKALVCTSEQHRETLARQLAQNGYQVFVAQDTGQAVERMREKQLDVVLLDPEFDSAEQGAAFVTREVNVLRPAQRRRLFFVLLSPVLRTMETHAAFLHNVNAIVNVREIEELPRILELALRDYNELYKEFKLALNVPAL